MLAKNYKGKELHEMNLLKKLYFELHKMYTCSGKPKGFTSVTDRRKGRATRIPELLTVATAS